MLISNCFDFTKPYILHPWFVVDLSNESVEYHVSFNFAMSVLIALEPLSYKFGYLMTMFLYN
jgi:hypothetical protein